MPKLIVLLYTSNKQFKKGIEKTIPLITASKWVKYLGINLTKEIKDLYMWNCKILLKEIKEALNKLKGSLCS